MDPRKEALVEVIVDVFGTDEGDYKAQLLKHAAVDRFVNDPESMMLQVYTLKTTKEIQASTTAVMPDGVKTEVHLIKKAKQALPTENIRSHILITTTLESPLWSLYLSLHNIYGPKLLKNPDINLDDRLKKLIVYLEKGLRNTIVQTGKQAKIAPKESETTGVRSIADEIEFWKMPKGSSNETERAQAFLAHFENEQHLAERYEKLQEVDVDDVIRLIEDTQDVLNEVWSATDFSGDPYPQNRMAHLFELTGTALAQYIRTKIENIKIWTDDMKAVDAAIKGGVRVCETWNTATSDLTTTDWRARWKGKHVDKQLQLLSTRLHQILEVRHVIEQLNSLLPRSQIEKFQVHQLPSVFDGLALLAVGPFIEPKWKAALRDFDRMMRSIEQHAATLLKNRIFALADRPQLLVGEFRKFEQLLLREGIGRELESERESLLGQLLAHLEDLRNEFDGKQDSFGNGTNNPKGSNMSDCVDSIIWAHQIMSKVSQTTGVVTRVLPGVNGIDDFISLSRELTTNIENYTSTYFNRWSEDLQESMRQGGSDVILKTSGKLMDLDISNDGKLKVHYSERLVILLREVRQLSELGFKIPKQIQDVTHTGEKFYRYGLKLKGVANFYNTIGEQIIPSQMGLLLKEASQFERIVKDNKGATWDRPEVCEEYMERLMVATDSLTSRNRKLRNLHTILADRVCELMKIDMYRRQKDWEDKVAECRTIFDKEAKYNSEKSMIAWKHHWDQQLYKAFEFQYRSCLEVVSDNLYDMNVDLCFSAAEKRLVFRPSLEELRARYYRSLQVFLDLPKQFQGFSQAKGLYETIPERNAEELKVVFFTAEDLFVQLRRIIDAHQEWVVLGTVDIDEFVQSRLTEVPEWEANFKALKKKRKDTERIPDSMKVGCFNVSFIPFKNALDELIERFSDALLLSLNKSAADNLNEVEEYLATSMKALSTKPTNLEEMGTAKTEWKAISAKRKEIQRIMTETQKKNMLLKQMAATPLDTVSIKPKWKDFVDSLEAFHDMLEEQREALKTGISDRVKECQINVDSFCSQWLALKPNVEGVEMTSEIAAKVLGEIATWKGKLEGLAATAAKVVDDSQQFEDLGVPDFAKLQEARAEIDQYEKSWSIYGEFTTALEEISKQLWVSYRGKIFDFEDFLTGWNKKLKDQPRGIVMNYITNQTKSYLKSFPILRKVTGELFEKQHWKILFTKLNMNPNITTATLTVGHFLAKRDQLISSEPDINALAARAQGEVTIREAVQELRVWAEQTEFELIDHTTVQKQKTSLIKGWKDLFTKVSDQISLVSSLKESPYFPPFADQANHFEKKLTVIDECLQSLNLIQRKWVYLEPIFGRGALPAEQPRFERIDQDFRGIMKDIKASPIVIKLAEIPNLKDTVVALLDQLERCQKALNDFLEQKRNKFARFYFIGDDDLLEILGQAQNPAVIENHLKKLFMGIHCVNFSEDKTQITAMKSSAKEVVQLLHPVLITENVEDWLENLSHAMEDTLSQLLVDCVRECDYNKFPSQILNLAEMVTFTQRIEEAIESKALPAVVQQLEKQLEELTSIDCSDDYLLQLKIQALVLDLIHNIEVARDLSTKQVTSPAVWDWHKQLRFYLNRGLCEVRMCDAKFKYSYEYQGNAGKLVHTPLTDKCYLVLTQGMHLGYGGNPYGPAGTGKTESVKALGQAFGRQTLVFNCDEGIDFQSMGRIFTGLIKSGAWGCFDEFNRLKEDQLSAVSQQIQVIQAALKKGEPTCDLLGRTITVNGNAAIFVTMNPASKEYGGRSKLPHNLKQLFRAVAMSVPDLGLIAEVILYSEGFKYAAEIGRKVVEVYLLAKQLLTPQQHYDWGLRALKTILKHGGQLIHKERKNGGPISKELEATLMIGALKINTLSKLTFPDSLRFSALINDVFPGIKSEDIEYKELEIAIRNALQKMNLEQGDNQIKKILQLHEALHQRMGVVVVGPSGCGKTVMLNVLHAAHESLGHQVVRHVMNPKALEREKLLGHMDNDTREWFDGVLTASARQVMRETPTTNSWIICDGDVDPEWVESLNSVLDDNHLLTMPNGERIKFGDNVNFVFETHDLQFASPATVSRMGMIFLSEEDADVRALLTAWIRKSIPEQLQSLITGWFDEFFYRTLNWCNDKVPIVTTTKMGLVTTALTFLKDVKCKEQFVVELIRGMGSNFDLEVRSELASTIFDWADEKCPDKKNPLNVFYNEELGCLACYVEENEALSTESLSVSEPPVVLTPGMQYYMDMIKKWMANLDPFIVVGPEGCGKTLLLTNSFKQLRSAGVAVVHCSAQTKAANVIQKLNDSCAAFSTSQGKCLRPKEGERLILFLKDLNLPKPDQYNTIQLIAFLQQLITHKGFHDDNLEWVRIENVQIIGSMNPATTVGRNELSARFSAITNVLYMNYPKQQELELVYKNFLKAVISLAPKLLDDRWRSDEMQGKLASSMIGVYENMKKKFTVDDQRHYLFNPRDLTEWTFGLLRYDLSSQDILDIWSYEASRLFADRLVDVDEQKKFAGMVVQNLRNTFRYEPQDQKFYFTSLVAGDSSKALMPELGSTLDRIPVANFKELVSDGLYTYQREFKELRMLLFPQVLDNIAFQDRVLSRPGGSLLLVGASGVGRRSTVTLVCHMKHMKLVTANVTLNYDKEAFRNELKELLKLVGIEGQQAVYYFEDHQIVTESMLEDINSLLSSGNLPGLFTPQELDAILSPLKEAFASDGRFRSVTDFFVSRVQKNLHICLSMDPTSEKFGVRCESNPAIYNKCTILWMGRWDKDGMRALPGKRLQVVLGGMDEKSQDGFCDQVIEIHNTMIERGATPNKYVAFLDNYVNLYKTNQVDLEQRKKHLQGGLSKLSEASTTVDVLSKDAGEKQKLVADKQKEADRALETITERMSVASERKIEVESIRQTLGAEEQNLAKRKVVIEQELKDVQPLLETAKQAVGGIKKDNLSELRAFRQPPPAIAKVLAACLTLVGENDLSWQNIKATLGRPSFKEEIMHFDAANVSVANRKKVEDMMKKDSDAFDEAKIKRVNVAAAPLCTWCLASVQYSKVLESVAPLRAEFEAANRKLDQARNRLTQCETELKTLDDEVRSLKSAFAKTTSEAESLKVALKRTTEILNAAEGLLGKLSGEQSRWDKQVKGLVESLLSLPSAALLAAAFVTYLGGFSEDIRSELMNQWKASCRMKEFNFMSFMATESEFLKWKAEGLPSDTLSMQNGLIITNSVQYPFVIDPNSQAVKWLSNHLKERKLEVVMIQDPKFVTTLELSVRFGKTLIVTEVDGVVPLLYPLLRKDLIRQGPRWVVQCGDKVIDFSEEFRVYMITRHAAPDIPANAAAIITEVNFTVTRSGLEGQLLGLTLNHENPELEKKKSELLAQEDGLKIKLAELEKRLLEELSASEGNILENKALIESLDQTKTESVKIADSLTTSKDIQADLDRQREMYRPIAKAGSILYFLIAALKAVNNMYDFSLPAFITLFNKNLREEPEQGQTRIQKLSVKLKLKVFYFVCRSLFKDDRLMFGLHLVHCLQPDQFLANEWELFSGELVTDSKNGLKLPQWAQADRAEAWKSLSATFPDLIRQLRLSDDNLWSNWARNPRCEMDFPATGGGTPFQRLLLLQALRPDRLQSAMTVYVCDAVGVKSMAPPSLNFQDLVNEGQPTEPILFITSAGADPTQELEEFAVKNVGQSGFAQLALGSGQTELALQMVVQAAKDGTWLCLKNLHLVTHWLVELENTLKACNPKPSFRLWLTTEAHGNFPSILLQQSLKITYESPPGIKANLLRTYEAWDEGYISKGSVTRAQMLFILAWFHALAEERRIYIPQGFTKFYEFSFADLRSGADIIDSMFEKLAGKNNKEPQVNTDAIPWATIWGLFKFAIYGGRIDNDHDVRVLVTYLGVFFNKATLSAAPGPASRKVTQGVELPYSNVREDYIRLIMALPNTDLPTVFGLPENIEGTVQKFQSAAVLSQLRKLAVSSSMTSKFNRSVWRQALAPILKLWESLSQDNNRAVLSKPNRLSRDEASWSPVDSFIALECNEAYKLISGVNNMLTDLSNVIYGAGLVTPELLKIGNTLMNGAMPWVWQRNWYGPDEPAWWLKELSQRKLALGEWLNKVDRNEIMAHPFVLPQLLRPRTFLNAFRQESARRSGIAIDSLKLTATWNKLLLPPSATVQITVEGCLLQGCSFQNTELGPLAPNAPIVCPVGPVTFAYINQNDPEPYPGKDGLAVPMYCSTTREEYICEIRMPCKGGVQRWILAGVALFLAQYN